MVREAVLLLWPLRHVPWELALVFGTLDLTKLPTCKKLRTTKTLAFIITATTKVFFLTYDYA